MSDEPKLPVSGRLIPILTGGPLNPPVHSVSIGTLDGWRVMNRVPHEGELCLVVQTGFSGSYVIGDGKRTIRQLLEAAR